MKKNVCYGWKLKGVLLAALLALALPGAASAIDGSSITVTNNADSGAGSLRQAIADICDNGTITFDGDYTITLASQLIIDKNLAIYGAGHTVTVSGNNSVRVFNISSGTVSLKGLTIINGKSSTTHGGGGIYNTGTLTVMNCSLSGNSSQQDGGGIWTSGALTVTGCSLSGNNAGANRSAGYGGGIYIDSGTVTVTVTDSTFSGNSVHGLGSGICYNGEMLTVTGCTFTDNLGAPGIENDYGGQTLTVTGCTFSNNNVAWDAIRSSYPSATVTVTDSSFSTTVGGTGISNMGTLTVTGCTFSGSERNGIQSAGNLTVTGCSFTGTNVLNGFCIRIYNYSYSPPTQATVTDCTFTGNSANTGDGGAILIDYYFDNTDPYTSPPQVTVAGCTFTGNSAPIGGGISNRGGRLTVTNSTFTGNSATSGSGGAIYTDGDLTVTGCTFSGNTASNWGGGICNYWDGQMTVTGCTFSGNSASAGGGIYSNPVWFPAEVTNSTFFGNSANAGGGIANAMDGQMTVTNSTFFGNSAITGGGIYNFTDEYGTLNFANTIIAGSLSGGDCYNQSTISANSNNLVQDGSCSDNGINFLTGDPLLGALADNGGPTQTMALSAGSPAIDAGSAAWCPATDQRGVARPQGAACDIGAYEAVFITVTARNKTITYGDAEPAYDFTTSPAGVAFTTEPACAVTESPHTAFGTYTIACSGGVPADSSSIVVYDNGTLTITKATPTATLAVANSPVTYDGSAHGAAVAVSQSSVSGSARNILTGGTAGQTAAGPYGVTADFVPDDTVNYNTITGISAGAFVISKADPQVVLSVTNSPVTYDGSVHAAAVSSSGTSGIVSAILTGGADSQTTAGTYAVTADFAPADTSNYNTLTGVSAGDFTIGKATPTATLSVTNSPVTYDGSAHGAAVTISQSSVPGSVGTILTGGADSQTTAGTYGVTADFTPTNTANYNSLTGLPAGDFVISCGAAITVTSNADSGPGSLRDAIANACDGGTITFSDNFTITLASELGIGKNLTIDGAGHAIAVSGNDAVGVFIISGGTVSLNALTIEHGRKWYAGSSCSGDACYFGGIYNHGALTLTNCSLSENAGYWGGAISNANSAALTVANCSLSGNAAVQGGGIYNNLSTVTVINSSFSGNSATRYQRRTGDGGGIYNQQGTVTVTNGTLSGNTATDSGGGIFSYAAVLNYANTIIANSGNGGDCSITGGSVIGTNRNNLVQDGSCSDNGSNFLTGDPLLGPLAENGGPTQTMALLAGSAALDAGSAAYCPATDQRGITRPQGAACDIGAFELEVSTTTTTVEPTTTTTTISPCPAPNLTAPSGAATSKPAFSWTKADDGAWYNIMVWSEARGGIVANPWFGPTSCSGNTCTAAQLGTALPAGNNWWWLNVYYGDTACGFVEQPGGKWKLAVVGGCTTPPVLSQPDSAVITTGTKPTFIFSDTGAEWYNVNVWTSAGYLALNQWEDATVKCSAGTCTIISNSSFGAGTTNWWWLNTYSDSCGFQMQPGGLWKSFTVQ